MAKLNTINVVECKDGIYSIYSFSDDTKGNSQAETQFMQLAKSHQFSTEAINVGLEDGRMEKPGCVIYLLNSE